MGHNSVLDLIRAEVELRNLVNKLMVFWVALQHRLGNPIVDNCKEDERTGGLGGGG